MVNLNNSYDKPESDSKPDYYPNAQAIVKHRHSAKQKHQTPPQEYLSPTTTPGKKSKEGPRSKPDACSLKDKDNTYQALILQQQSTDLNSSFIYKNFMS